MGHCPLQHVSLLIILLIFPSLAAAPALAQYRAACGPPPSARSQPNRPRSSPAASIAWRASAPGTSLTSNSGCHDNRPIPHTASRKCECICSKRDNTGTVGCAASTACIYRGLQLTSKHKTLNQCWFNVGPASQLVQRFVFGSSLVQRRADLCDVSLLVGLVFQVWWRVFYMHTWILSDSYSFL